MSFLNKNSNFELTKLNIPNLTQINEKRGSNTFARMKI